MGDRKPAVTALFILLGLWLLLAAGSSGHVSVTDEVGYYFMARSFVDHGWFEVPAVADSGNLRSARQGRDGRHYLPFSFGHAVYLSPWVWLGNKLQPALGVEWAPVFVASFAHSLSTATTWALFFLILLTYGVRHRRAAIFAVLAMASSLAFPYARSLFSEPLLALLLTAAWLCFRQQGSRWFLFAALGGLALALAITVRPTTVVLLPAFWFLAWEQHRSQVTTRLTWRPSGWIRGGWRLGVVCLLAILGIGLFIGYNYARFGQLFTTGFTVFPDGRPVGWNSPIWYGLAVFLISPGKAIWLYAPLLVLGAVGWRSLWKCARISAISVAWLFIANLVLHSLWCQPEGGYCWGPRFFVGILPLLLLPAAIFVDRESGRLLGLRTAAVVLVCLGIGVQLLGTVANFSTVISLHRLASRSSAVSPYYYPAGRYNLRFLPFQAQKAVIADTLSSGDLLSERLDAITQYTNRLLIVTFPYWSDTLDIWSVHLVKDGFSPVAVWTVQIGLVLAGLFLLSAAFRRHKPVMPSATPEPNDLRDSKDLNEKSMSRP